MSDIDEPTFVDNRLTDIGEVVSLTNLPRSIPQKHYVFLSLTLIPVSG